MIVSVTVVAAAAAGICGSFVLSSLMTSCFSATEIFHHRQEVGCLSAANSRGDKFNLITID